jgi:YD repeat-containing protein
LTYPDHSEYYRSDAYGQLNRILRQHQGQTDADLSLSYDPRGALSAWQLDDLKIARTNDPLGRPTQLSIEIGGQTQAIVDQIHYLPFDNRATQIDFSHGLRYRASFDRHSGALISQQLERTQNHFNQNASNTSTSTSTANQNNLLQQQFNVRPGIGITHIQDLINADHNSSYQYDQQGRLIQAESALGQFSYVYDANSNRLQKAEQINNTENKNTKIKLPKTPTKTPKP